MSQNEVPLAVVPAAGLGTRLAPATWAVPKEIMPIGLYPMIQRTLEEIVESGIPRVAVVVSPAKPALSGFLNRWKKGGGIDLETVSQPRAIGLADALLRVRSLAGDGPIALVLPDNVFFPYAGERPALAQVVKGFAATGKDTTGVVRVPVKDARTFGHAGLVEVSARRGSLVEIEKLHSKRKGSLRLGGATFAHKTFARTVLLPHFFDYLRESEKRDPRSDEVPALQKILRRHGFGGVLLKGRGFDAGNPAGYAAALAYWAGKSRR
jgi:UTP--glucose-1-phosphate uridylyltransferase